MLWAVAAFVFKSVKTILGIEFSEGIRENIGEPDYLNVSTNNLIDSP